MQTISTALTNAMNQGTELRSMPQIIAEWNMNVHADISTNYPQNAGTDPGEDPTLFPIASIVMPERPAAGMPKARVNKSRVYSETDPIHYRTVDANSIYKYWSSYDPSAQTATSGSFLMPRTVKPTVVYTAPVKVNKMVITFEQSWAAPNNFTIATTTNGTTFTTVATNPTIGTDGRITLYLQAGGTWTTTVNRANTTTLQGIQVVVNGMAKANSHVELIEMGLRLEQDLTSDCIDFSVTKSMSADDIVSPVGVISANQATLTLDNSQNHYDPQNSSGPYYGLINVNAEIRISVGVDTSNFGGAGLEYVQQGVFYVDTWGNDLDNSVQVSATDFSKFLMVQKMLPIAYKNKYVWEIVEQILETAGFKRYSVNLDTTKSDIKIPFAWFDGTKFVWEVLQELCRSTQSVVWINELGTLQFASRDWLFRASQTPVRQFNSVKVGSTMPDIVDLADSFTMQANKVVITYTPTTLSMNTTNNKTVTNSLWQPTGTETVQSCVLAQPLTSGETTNMYIDPTFGNTFPYTSYVNVEGEIIKYDGKVYKTKVHGATTYTICHNSDDKHAADIASDAASVSYSLNNFTGQLKNLTRGCFASPQSAHAISISGWTGLHLTGSTSNSASSHFKEDNLHSMMKVTSPSNAKYGLDYYCAVRGAFTDSFHVFGTQLRFNPNRKDGSAGLFFNLQSDNSSGYFIEINTTNLVNEDLAQEKSIEAKKDKAKSHDQKNQKKKVASAVAMIVPRNTSSKGTSRKSLKVFKEIRILRRYADGSLKALTSPIGFEWNVTPGLWYQIDVTQNGNAFQVFVNGILVAAYNDPYSSPLTAGKCGMFTDGLTHVDFEYFYAVKNPGSTAVGDSTFLDKIQGDYVNGYIDKEVFYKWRLNRRFKYLPDPTKVIQWIFDDFGPYVHEIKEYNVLFDKVPAWSADVYIDNQMAQVVKFQPNPFGAYMLVASKSRNNYDSGSGTVIISGEDDSVSAQTPIQRQMMIFGVTINQTDAQTYTLDNTLAEAQQTTLELDFTGDWIQSLAMAKSLGDWITAHFGNTCDVKTMNIFAHPALQVTDFVSLNYPQKNILPASNFYHITGYTIGWSQSLTGNLTVRKAML